MRFVFDVNPQDGPVHQWARTTAVCCIGRSDACDLVLASELVSAQHAMIDGSGARPVLRDLKSTNGTYLNGKRVETPLMVSVGDLVMFGQNGPTLTIRCVEAEPDRTSRTAFHGDSSRPARNEVRIGRAPDNDVVLEDETVSAYHGRLIMDRPAHGILEDLGSTNGIAIREANNKVAKAEIIPGTQIYFGSALISAEELFRHGPHWPKTIAVQVPIAEPIRTDSRPYVLIGLVAVVGVLACALLFLAFGRGTGGAPPKTGEESSPSFAGQTDVASPSQPARTDAPNENAAVASPPPARAASLVVNRPEPAAAPAMNVEAIVHQATPAIVWIGVRHTTSGDEKASGKGDDKSGGKDEVVVPYAVAFAVKPDLLVTTANAAALLQQIASKGDFEAIAWANDDAIKIRSFQLHPQYQAESAGSDASMRHNLGVVQLATPMAATCSVASREVIHHLQPGTPLLLVGYYSLRKEIDEYDRTQFRQEHGSLSIRSAESDRPGISPLFAVEMPSVKDSSTGNWVDGAPVFGADGTVVGISFIANGSGRIIPLDSSLWSKL
jgi:pSer/pThr/pTyr-binding forkhead associated (FHA) protein